jgi:hypothetical protein
MKITATKIIEELQLMGWHHTQVDELLIKDVIKIIDSKLKYHKGISIKK